MSAAVRTVDGSGHRCEMGVRVMAPMEFRPVTARDAAALARRGRARAARPSGGAVPQVPGSRTAAPWTRSREQVRVQVVDLAERLRRIRALPVRERVPLLCDESYCRGALDAGRWVLGVIPERPMDRQVAPVCEAAVFGQLAHAKRVFDSGDEDWDYAGGVLMLLAWLTGHVAEMSYPDQWGPSGVSGGR